MFYCVTLSIFITLFTVADLVDKNHPEYRDLNPRPSELPT